MESLEFWDSDFEEWIKAIRRELKKGDRVISYGHCEIWIERADAPITETDPVSFKYHKTDGE